MAKKKEPKMTKNGKPRKAGPQGLDRITMFAEKTTQSLNKVTERIQKWSDKTQDNVARDRLVTMIHQLGEATKALETVTDKTDALKNSDWNPPKAATYVKTEDFIVGEKVVIRSEYRDLYSSIDKRSLDNMKVLSVDRRGKRTAYLVTGAGYVPKYHMESFAE